jgi:hypothetical protein
MEKIHAGRERAGTGAMRLCTIVSASKDYEMGSAVPDHSAHPSDNGDRAVIQAVFHVREANLVMANSVDYVSSVGDDLTHLVLALKYQALWFSKSGTGRLRWPDHSKISSTPFGTRSGE